MKLLKLVPDNTNFNFLRWRKIAFGISVLLMVASIALVATRGLNFGVDFIGGQMIRTTFVGEQSAPVEALRESIGKLGYGDPTIQRFGAENQVSIRMKLPEGADQKPELANAMAEKIIAKVKEDHPKVRIDGVDSVSGKVSSELFEKGLFALIAAALGIAAYVWIRFEWQFGVGAIWALIHDVTLTFGLFALTQMEFDLNTIAALLTIIGYSLNDTIVVFDRVRENLRKYRKMDMIALLDLSTNETLARTVMTSLTMLMALVVLLVVGPGVIFGFTAAMTLGLFVGAYSSVYMANPILVWLGVGAHSFIPQQTDAEKAAAKLKEGMGGAQP